MEAGLMTTDLDGTVTSMNTGAERILGVKVDQVIAKPLKSVLKPEEADLLLSNPPMPGSLPYSRETELTLQSGTKIAIGFTAMDRINNRGEKVGTIVSFRDISELKQMQSEVMRMDRLASLGVLASGIAHEIKNPLAGIKTMAQACEEEFEETDQRREYLVRIIRQVNRLDDLLKTFFAFAKPKPPTPKPHSLASILREVMNLVEKKIKSSGIDYVERFEQGVVPVFVDSQQIQQVFLNLILNALDAMSARGTLTITAKNIEAGNPGMVKEKEQRRLRGNGRYVEVVVSDTGTGIPTDMLETIFDPFFTTKPNGVGLGLSIVYRIVEEHQGDIHVISHEGKGTSFILTLPTGDTE
jgi:PAS domain S-box-containing protein